MRQYIKNIILLIKYFIKIKKILIQNNYTNIKLYNFKNWHHGYAYFIVYKLNVKYFVKIDTKFLILQNDILVYKLASNSLKYFLVKIDNYFFYKNIQIVIFEFIDNGFELTEKHLDNEMLVKIIHILELLNKHQIIHRDIKLDNFFIINNKDIKILDFTFANSLNDSLGFKELELTNSHYATLEFLGNNLNNEPFIWNDCVALKNICLRLNKKLDLDCNKFSTYKINPSQEYLKQRKIKIKIKHLLKIKHLHRIINASSK